MAPTEVRLNCKNLYRSFRGLVILSLAKVHTLFIEKFQTIAISVARAAAQAVGTAKTPQIS